MNQKNNFTKVNSQEHSVSLDEESRDKITDQPDTAPPTFKEKVKNVLIMSRPMLITLVIDVGIPLAIYYISKRYISILIALILSGIPPLLSVIYTFIKRRRLDILGCIFVVSYIVSAVLSLITGKSNTRLNSLYMNTYFFFKKKKGDVRLALLRDSTVTALISVMFFVTLIPLKTRWFTVRPLIFMITQQMFSNTPPLTWVDQEGKECSQPLIDFNWEHISLFRKFCYIITAAWSVVLMGEFIAKIIMIESTLDIDRIVLYGNIILIVVVVTMTSSTMVGSHYLRKRSRATIAEWMKVNDHKDKLPL